MTQKYLSVTALTKYIKRKIDLDPHLSHVWIRGEISNFNHHSRGHMYLTIKDEQSRIQSVMFAGNNRRLKFKPENGMNILIKGNVSVFESFGQYQLYIEEMEPDGIGALYLAYEQLKEKLQKKGYFSDDHKKQLPTHPQHIGIITSPTGAAVRDIITTLTRRYPIAQTTVIPTLVQGDQAAAAIAKAITDANQLGLFDLLIVGRGGGSIEDLWPFNEEVVAQALFNSHIPTISAVGHETDHTISDFVADVRAATPTGAAEIAVPSQVELQATINQQTRSLTRSMTTLIETNQSLLKRFRQSYAFRYPENLIKQKEQELDRESQRLVNQFAQLVKQKSDQFIVLHDRLKQQHLQIKHDQAQHELTQLIRRLNVGMSQVLDAKQIKLISVLDKLSLLNPLEIMKRGFALPYTQNDQLIRSVKEVDVQDEINIKLSDGAINCRVLQVKEHHDD